MRTLLWTIALAFCFGCATNDQLIIDATKRAPTENIDLFVSGRTPNKPFQEIALLTYLGDPQDELEATRWFVKRARKLGANGVVVRGDEQFRRAAVMGSYATASVNRVWKASAIVYEEPQPRN
jgi:hypothetical protein